MNYFQDLDHASKHFKTFQSIYFLGVILTALIGPALCALPILLLVQEEIISCGEATTHLPFIVFFIMAIVFLGFIIVMENFRQDQLKKNGGKILIDLFHSKKISKTSPDEKKRSLYSIVEEMAIAGGVPIPEIHILHEEKSINAFSAGVNLDQVIIAVTTGAVEKLNPQELQSLIANQFAQIINGHTKYLTFCASQIYGLIYIPLLGKKLIRDRSTSGGILAGIFGLLLMFFGFIGTIFASTLMSRISYPYVKEFDTQASVITNSKNGIGGVLRKIMLDPLAGKISDILACQMKHLFFANPECHFILKNSYINTHPPISERIENIDPKFLKESPIFAQREATLIANIASLTTATGQSEELSNTDKTMARVNIEKVIVDSVGKLNDNGLTIAHDLLSNIPQELKNIAYDPSSSHIIPLALLLDSRDDILEKQKQIIANSVFASELEHIIKSAIQLQNLSSELKLPTLAITIPSLKETKNKEQLGKVVFDLIKADNKISLFEILTYLILELKIISPEENQKFKYFSNQMVQIEASTLFALLAYSGHKEKTDISGAFQSAIEKFKTPNIKIPESKELRLDVLKQNCRSLFLSVPSIKEEFLRACITCITYDGKITHNEMDILKMFGIILEFPIPAQVQ